MDSIELVWSGPHRWPRTGRQPRIDALEAGGVYLITVEHHAGYLVYCAGHTVHFQKRFRQHDRFYRDGTYTIFDHDAFAAGRRKKVWAGFWFKRPRLAEACADFVRRDEEIRVATVRWLDGCRIFVARTDVDVRLKKRMEAALMAAFMAAEPPVRDMPDKGMTLSPRWSSEAPIRVRNVSTSCVRQVLQFHSGYGLMEKTREG